MKRVTLYVPEHQWRRAHRVLPATTNFSALFQRALDAAIEAVDPTPEEPPRAATVNEPEGAKGAPRGAPPALAEDSGEGGQGS